MNTTPEALKQLYEALGGDSANVSNVSTNVEALKFIYAHLGGEEDVSEISTIPDMIDAIATLNISSPSGTKTITANGTYDVKNYANAQVNVQANWDSHIRIRNNSTKTITLSYMTPDGIFEEKNLESGNYLDIPTTRRYYEEDRVWITDGFFKFRGSGVTATATSPDLIYTAQQDQYVTVVEAVRRDYYASVYLSDS